MLVTIYTDAGFRHGQGASWAFYAKCELGTLTRHGLVPEDEKVNGSGHAELYAVCKATHLVLARWPQSKVLLFNTDSREVCHFMWPYTDNPKNPDAARLFERLQKFMTNAKVEARTKHVKAHTDRTDVRSSLNKMCDKLCREAFAKKIK